MTFARTGDEVGIAFAHGLAAKDTDSLLGLFRDDVDFRGMTPSRFWEAGTPHDVVHDVLLSWFEPQDVIEQVESASTEQLEGRWRVDYRYRVRSPDGLFRVEQRAYFDIDGTGRISKMNAVCSGFRPIADK